MKQAIEDLTAEIKDLHADFKTEANTLRKRNRQHWRRIAFTALITIWLSLQVADWHIINCALVNEPESRLQQRICSLTTFWHDHPISR